MCIRDRLYPEERAIVVGKGGTIGVDMQRYEISKKTGYRSAIRNQYGISDEAFVYGFAGRVSVDKGFTELLAAFRKITESESDAKLLIVGSMEAVSYTHLDVYKRQVLPIVLTATASCIPAG